MSNSRLKTGKYTAGVIVVKEFSAKLQIKLVSELRYALFNVFGLYPQILFVVKSVYHNGLQIYLKLSNFTIFVYVKQF